MSWLFDFTIPIQFLLSAAVAAVPAQNTLPEFECIVIESKNPSRVSQLFGKKKNPSLSLRSYTSGAWELKVNGGTKELQAQNVVKTNRLVTNQVSYQILHGNTSMGIDLNGTPPSRNGFLWELKAPPLQSKILAHLTCH